MKNASLRFKSWLASEGRSAAAVADQLGCTRAYVYMLSGGHRTPSLAIAVAIERETKGAIRCVDWIPAAVEAA